jgi:hypothetical protein
VTIKGYQCPSDATLKAGVAATGNTVGSFASYGANGQVFGTVSTTVSAGVPTCTNFNWKGSNSLPAAVPDGLSNTIFWTEKLAYCTSGATGGSRWAANGNGGYMALIGTSLGGANSLSPNIQAQSGITRESNCAYYWPSGSHTGGLIVGLGDGSVRLVTSGISQLTFNLALVPNDGLVVGANW